VWTTKGGNLRALDNFARIWLQPTVAFLRSASSEIEKALAASTFLECYEWLELYVQADICPATSKIKLLQRFFEGVQVQYELLRNLPLWPQHVIEAAQRMREPAGEGRPRLNNRTGFRTLIQLSASMAADLAFSDAEKAFASLLLFSKHTQWERFLAKPPHPGELAQALSGRTDRWLDGNRNLAYAGLVKTVEHTQGLSHLMQESQQSHSRNEWFSFKDGVVAAHGWRLQPQPDAQIRYNAMLAVTDQLIVEGLSRDEIAMQGNFGDEARLSLALWRTITGPRGEAAGGR
jgi:hypothetical protein